GREMRRMTSTSTRLIRGVAAVTAAVAVVTAACGPAVPGAAPNTSATLSPSGAKATSGKKFTIGWSLALFDHPVYQIMIKAANDAAEKRGVNLLIANGKK